MKYGDFSRVSIKDKVLTIGYPPVKIMGVRLKYTEGVISAVTEIKDNPVVFQTTVPIQPGNSGVLYLMIKEKSLDLQRHRCHFLQ